MNSKLPRFLRYFVAPVAALLIGIFCLLVATDSKADNTAPVLFVCYNAEQDDGIYLMLQNTEPSKAVGLIFNTNGIYVNQAQFGYEPVSDSWIAFVNNSILVVSTTDVPMTINMSLPKGSVTLECK